VESAQVVSNLERLSGELSEETAQQLTRTMQVRDC